MNRIYLMTLLAAFSLVWSGALTSCASADDDEAGLETRAQEQEGNTPVCPDGHIPWTFKSTSIGKGESGVLNTLDDGTVPVEHPWAIEPQTATCDSVNVSGQRDADGDGRPDRQWTEDWNQLRKACAGNLSCEFEPTLCTGAFSAEYTCSASDRDEDGEQRVYTATRASDGTFSMACAQPESQKVTVEAQSSQKCILAECHGRTYRDPVTMECKADSTKEEAGLTTFGWFTYESGSGARPADIRPTHRVQSSYNQEFIDQFDLIERVYTGAVYEFPIHLRLDARLPLPRRSTISVWVADYFDITNANGVKRPSRGYYRCLAFEEDLYSSDFTGLGPGIYAKKVNHVFSDECIKGETSLGSAIKDLEEGDRIDYKFSTFVMTYDIEGRTALHENLTLSPGSEPGKQKIDTNPLCTPNPVEFYYNGATRIYDMASYYRQRPSRTYGKTFKFEQTGSIKLGKIARLGEIGGVGVEARKKEIILSAQSPVPQALPVEITWLSRNFYRDHMFQPFYDIDKEGMSAGWFSGKPEEGMELPNLRADVYLMKSNAGFNGDWANALFVGKIPLDSSGLSTEGNAPFGKTDSKNVLIPRSVVKAFMKSSGPHYIGPDDGPQRYDIGYCINSDAKYGSGGDAFSDHPDAIGSYLDQRSPTWQYIRILGGSRSRIWGNYVESDEPGMTPSVAVIKSGRKNAFVRKDCTWQTTPLMIDVDYFETPQLPISSTGLSGSQSNTTSGDGTMSGQSDNDSQEDCDDPGKQSCDDTFVAGTRSEGADRRSYFNISSESDRTQGSEVSASARGTMLGFTVLDPADPEDSTLQSPTTESLGWPSRNSNNSTLSISITPDWDGLRNKLNRAMTGTSVEWETGRYGGIMGLGVGWGIKNRWLIGPVPVTVIFTVSVGASVSLSFNIQFVPSEDEQYTCLDTQGQDCVQYVNETKSFREAVKHCNISGGRLAEARTQAEATALLDAIPANTQPWIGAQLAYYHPDPQCKTSFDAALCAGNRTHYRWVSDNTTFAASREADVNGEIFALDATRLDTRYPNDAAIYYDSASSTLNSDSIDIPRTFVCQYDAAAKQDFLKWGFSLGLGLAAGFGLQGCVPSDNPGFCLGATLNVVALTIVPALSNSYHWLYRQSSDSTAFRRNGNTNINVPLTITLFEGAFKAVASFLWFSVSWTIASFDGIKLLEQTLYDFNLPVSEEL